MSIRERPPVEFNFEPTTLAAAAFEKCNQPNWMPLEKKLSQVAGGTSLFAWVRREGGVEFYKNIDTGRYLLLDSNQDCWRYKDQKLELADFDHELEYAMGTRDREFQRDT